jgi:UDP-galactopyranose mutase
MPHKPDLVVFSHLRWDFVWQRPQHLLSRLASDRRVFFIEEPLRHDREPPGWERSSPAANVLVCRPRTPLPAAGFHDDQLPALRGLLASLLAEEDVSDPVVWLCTPMALPLAEEVRPQALVYDCMDDLSAFLSAPPQLAEREAKVLERADVVFTGGPSLYRARKGRHPNIHCFPSSVDVDHFGKARRALPEPVDQAPLPHPRLGFFGVLDERLDVAIVDGLARARPDWQLVLVGPVVKIPSAALPRHPNIHYTGPRRYDELPAYLSGWDVCLLPFARNAATRFISPTKTLEHMAAEKPIVSTPLRDVVEPYGDIVYAGDSPGQFLAACECALKASADERKARAGRMRAVLSRTSWDHTAEQMRRLIDEDSAGKQAASAVEARPEAPVTRREAAGALPGPPTMGLAAARQHDGRLVG